MIEVNVRSMVLMCHYFLDDLSSFPSSAVITFPHRPLITLFPTWRSTQLQGFRFKLQPSTLWGVERARNTCADAGARPTETEFDIIAGAYASSLKAEVPLSMLFVLLWPISQKINLWLHTQGVHSSSACLQASFTKMVISTVAGMFRLRRSPATHENRTQGLCIIFDCDYPHLCFCSVDRIYLASAFQSLHLGVLAGVVYILLFIFLYGTVTISM